MLSPCLLVLVDRPANFVCGSLSARSQFPKVRENVISWLLQGVTSSLSSYQPHISPDQFDLAYFITMETCQIVFNACVGGIAVSPNLSLRCSFVLGSGLA